jgi:hypothetical protein
MMELLKQIMITEVLDGLQEFSNHLVMRRWIQRRAKRSYLCCGSEYLYQDSFAMRLGYFHESPVKGARQFFSLGAGFKYNVVKVDVLYLFASKVKNPLENTSFFVDLQFWR